MSQYYCGIDLHTRTSQLCLTDAKGNKVEEANLPNDLSQILGFLQPFGQDIQIAGAADQHTRHKNKAQ